ncbi:hypothetical protein BKA69DRAFT_1104534 [Paraphysoderma sedebokerense]|nr:hypothetical protein BKA69DRAFT_1104534 [Paraphysoderma sedebokerense]
MESNHNHRTVHSLVLLFNLFLSASLLLPSPSSAQLPPLSTSAYSQFIVLDSKLYILGGSLPNTSLPSLDPTTAQSSLFASSLSVVDLKQPYTSFNPTYSPLPPAPFPVTSNAISKFSSTKFVIWGGNTTGPNVPNLLNLYSYDINGKEWKPQAADPDISKAVTGGVIPPSSSCSAQINASIVIHGGCDSPTPFDGPFPQAAPQNPYICKVRTSTRVLNMTTLTAENRLSDIMPAVRYCSLTRVGDSQFILLGGDNDFEDISFIWEYNMDTNRWRKVFDKFPISRHSTTFHYPYLLTLRSSIYNSNPPEWIAFDTRTWVIVKPNIVSNLPNGDKPIEAYRRVVGYHLVQLDEKMVLFYPGITLPLLPATTPPPLYPLSFDPSMSPPQLTYLASYTPPSRIFDSGILITPPPPPSSSSFSEKGLWIGVGVAIGVVVLAIAGFIGYRKGWFTRRKTPTAKGKEVDTGNDDLRNLDGANDATTFVNNSEDGVVVVKQVVRDASGRVVGTV